MLRKLYYIAIASITSVSGQERLRDPNQDPAVVHLSDSIGLSNLGFSSPQAEDSVRELRARVGEQLVAAAEDGRLEAALRAKQALRAGRAEDDRRCRRVLGSRGKESNSVP